MRKTQKGGTRSESRPMGDFFVKSTQKPERDDKPARTPKERNTGSSVARRLSGKVIG
jgi:hypothetical protein